MSEPTVSEQILEAVSAVYAAMAGFAEKAAALVGWTLSSDLDVNGNKIVGGTGDEISGDIELETGSGDIRLTPSGRTYVRGLVSEDLIAIPVTEDTTLLATEYAGIPAMITSGSGLTLTLDVDAPEPDSGRYFRTAILNATANAHTVARPAGGTINGAESDYPLGANSAANFVYLGGLAWRVW
jgi:hypothetical protein